MKHPLSFREGSIDGGCLVRRPRVIDAGGSTVTEIPMGPPEAIKDINETVKDLNEVAKVMAASYDMLKYIQGIATLDLGEADNDQQEQILDARDFLTVRGLMDVKGGMS